MQEKCNQKADKYLEFEPVIILVDSVLLSENAFRHVLYNRDFKVKLNSRSTYLCSLKLK